jgi:acetylornithine deacetylase/succinyl-diaminopimelate desuccinylase-like protein
MIWNRLKLKTIVQILFTFSLVASEGAVAVAQITLEQALQREGVQQALKDIDSRRAAIAQSLVEIGGIISPSGKEHRRAEAVADRMKAMGLAEVRVDETPNAIGMIPGRSGKAVIFVATLDDLATVATHQKEAGTMPRIEGDRVIGPGTNTSLVTSAMLAAAEALKKNGITPEHDLIFAAVAQEETGLIGMKKIYETYKDRAVGFIDILGDGQSISYGAIVIHWWKVIASGPAGHSLRGGLPNVNQAIGRSVDQILQLPHPKEYVVPSSTTNLKQAGFLSMFDPWKRPLSKTSRVRWQRFLSRSLWIHRSN